MSLACVEGYAGYMTLACRNNGQIIFLGITLCNYRRCPKWFCCLFLAKLSNFRKWSVYHWGNYAKTTVYLMVKIIFLSLFLNKAASFLLPVIKRMIGSKRVFIHTLLKAFSGIYFLWFAKESNKSLLAVKPVLIAENKYGRSKAKCCRQAFCYFLMSSN